MKNPSSVSGKPDEQQENSKPKGYKWLLHSIGKFLFVTVCLTIAYLSFLLIDAGVLFIIGFLLSDLIAKYSFVEVGFEGIRIFSACVIGLVYLFHLLYTLYDQVHFILRVFKRLRDEEEEE